MRIYDDSDMKIFGEGKNDVKPDIDTAEAFEMHKRSGNVEKAQRLGATLADRVDQLDISIDDMKDDTIVNHMRLLMIFSMVVGIEQNMPDRILVRTALNVFYDTLKKERPALYDSMSSSGAFTFYYLEYRRGGEISDNIAHAFAMLCGSDDDQKLIDAGRTLFVGYFEYAARLIEEMDFVKLS